MIGKTISHYKIIEKLGEGGMGEVYLAEDSKLKRQVAIKFLPSRITINETDKARFLQEAQAAAAINHPNVCVIYEIQDQDENPFIVMEHVDGLTLSDKIAADSLPIKQVVEYAFQIGEALQSAHNKGVVHRDVKSDNIMITSTNQIKVMDFCLAKLKGSVKLTKSTTTVGTLAYMAPEQIEGKPIDVRSDIFSFEVVLYKMLTGKLPFSGEYESALMYAILNEEPQPVQKVRTDVSSELIHVLNRALEKDPEDRYPNMKEILIDLKRIKRDSSKVTRRMTVQIPESEEVVVQKTEKKPIRKSKRYLGFSGAVLSVLIILVIFFLIFKPFAEEQKLPMKTRKFTSYKGWEGGPRLSPDGNHMAFNWMGDIYVKQVGGTGESQLTNTRDQDWAAEWSPDSKQIAFVRQSENEEQSGLYVRPALGRPGSERKLVQITWHWFNPSWSPDGRTIIYSDLDTAQNAWALFSFDIETHEKKQFTHPPTGWDDSWTRFSPDGRELAFVRRVQGKGSVITKSLISLMILSIMLNFIISEPVLYPEFYGKKRGVSMRLMFLLMANGCFIRSGRQMSISAL